MFLVLIFLLLMMIIFNEGPIVAIVMFHLQVFEQILEERPQIIIIGFLVKLKSPSVVAILIELIRESSTEIFNLCQYLFLFDLLIFVLDVSRTQPLPRKRPS